ncbi:MAG: sulfotransferase [Planctomycetaceae bacterium]|nr:sulfotransferase [Planctomycetota bacterium]NUN53284.1 sulfotransferase [Planctomycetaceae bacterium]
MQPEGAGPVFIVGCERSGTTLLRLMLNAHPALAIPGETWYLPELEEERERIRGEGAADWRERILAVITAKNTFPELGVPREEIAAALAGVDVADGGAVLSCAHRAFAAREGKPRWGDKTPGYVRRLPLLARRFPGASVIHVVRDGRDVALSLLDKPFGPKTVVDAAVHWKARVEEGEREGPRLFGARYREVRYEDLVAGPEERLRSLCTWLGLGFDAAMLRYHERAGSYLREEHHWHGKTRTPVAGDRSGRWKGEMAAGDQVWFQRIAGRTLARHGYEPTPHRSAAVSLRWAVRGMRLGAAGSWLRAKIGARRLLRAAGVPLPEGARRARR